MLKYIFLFSLLFILVTHYAQDFNKYRPLESNGIVPEDFTRLSSEKYRSDVDEFANDSLKIPKRIAKDFYLESNFAIGEILSNGRILFNDPLSNYLEDIYQKIKLGNPILADKNIRFYTSSSTIVNAYTTQEGVILFNTGLLAKLQTEDEIAYIMCHEIAHFLQKHSINQYTFNNEIDREKGSYKSENWETKMFAKANYSQKHEMEADSIGLVLFQNTAYNYKNSITALESLKTYFLPFESEISFNPTMLRIDTSLVKLPKLNFPSLDLEKIYSSKNNKFSTHPEIEVRIKRLSSQLISQDRPSTPNAIRTIAQFELCHLFLERAMYSHAIYVALALQVDYPDSQYLKETILKSIYGLSQMKSMIKIKVNDFYFSVSNQNDSKDFIVYPPEIKKIDRFLMDVAAQHWNLLAIYAFWDYLNTDQPINREITEERLKSLVQSFKSIYSNNNSAKEIIMDLVNSNRGFEVLYNAIDVKDCKSKIEKKEDRDNLKTDNLLVISPEYRKFNLTKEKAYRFLASEKLLGAYHEAIKDNTEKLKMESNILSNSFIQPNEVQTYNDVALIHSFLNEKMHVSSNSISSRKEDIVDLLDRYGTNKLALFGVYSLRFPKSLVERVGIVLWTGTLFPTLPLGIYHAVTPKFRTFNYTLLFDLSSEELIYSNLHRFKMKGNNAVVRSSLHNELLKIKKGKYE